jgi:hypothetical protein
MRYDLYRCQGLPIMTETMSRFWLAREAEASGVRPYRCTA